jgi:hypothetical protein
VKQESNDDSKNGPCGPFFFVVAFIPTSRQSVQETEMKHFSLALVATLAISAVQAQDYPLQARPKPTTATLVGVCEHHARVLMVAIFTYPDGHVLIVNGKQMQGFKDAAEIINYAATAGQINDLAQVCGDTTA